MFYTFARRLGVLLLLAVALSGRTASGQAAPGRVRLPGARTLAAATGRPVGRVPASETVPLTLALAGRDPQGLDTLLRRLYDPRDPQHGHFLTPEQFAARFSPTPAQCAAVAAFARAQGLTVTGLTANRLLLHLSAPSGAVEAAFGVHLSRFLDAHGRLFHAPDAEPSVPAPVAPLIAGVVGLDDSVLLQTHPQALAADPLASAALPLQVGTGVGGGLSPADIRAAYNLGGVAPTGAGQTLAVFELDGFVPSDVTAYERQYGLPQVPLRTILVDGGAGALGGGQGEVTLDIDLQIALAPGASQVLVYEGPNNGRGIFDTYNQIATDDRAMQVSTSWGLSEGGVGASFINVENLVFQELAAQGQTLYAAAGDHGAYDDGRTLSVDDPASQPYVTGVGGTSLQPVAAGGAYGSETTWAGGGGGVSAVWAAPAYQQGVVSAASLGSTAMRNVPDVALDADPNTGYSILVNGSWYLYGGTSCASPLWAAFTALVNQQRAANGSGPLGFANPALYAIGSGQFGAYANDFHDIADGSTNRYYPAVAGYDDATGWGSFNGVGLLADLAAIPAPLPLPGPPTMLTATPGNARATLSWAPVAGTTSYNLYRSLTSGGEDYPALQAGLTGTSYTDTGLTNGTTYYYVLTAVGPGGESYASNEASALPAAPVTTTVSGTVALQGWMGTGEPTPALTFTLTPAGQTSGGATTTTLTPAPTGAGGAFSFTLTGVAPGAYTLGVKGALWLRADVGVDTTAGSASGASVSLPVGDVNGDNVVDALDLGLLRGNFGTVSGPNFNAAADLNGDGVVDALDLGLLRGNFGKVGKTF